MKRFVLRAFPIAIVLVGCSSFNNSFNTYHGLPEPIASTIKEAEDEPTPEPIAAVPLPPSSPISPPTSPASKPRCDISPFLPFPKAPESPHKELQEATDIKTIERLERKYIKDLLNYLSDVRKRQREHEFKFNDRCDTVAK